MRWWLCCNRQTILKSSVEFDIIFKWVIRLKTTKGLVMWRWDQSIPTSAVAQTSFAAYCFASMWESWSGSPYMAIPTETPPTFIEPPIKKETYVEDLTLLLRPSHIHTSITPQQVISIDEPVSRHAQDWMETLLLTLTASQQEIT